jgi:hypothetical protein
LANPLALLAFLLSHEIPPDVGLLPLAIIQTKDRSRFVPSGQAATAPHPHGFLWAREPQPFAVYSTFSIMSAVAADAFCATSVACAT